MGLYVNNQWMQLVYIISRLKTNFWGHSLRSVASCTALTLQDTTFYVNVSKNMLKFFSNFSGGKFLKFF